MNFWQIGIAAGLGMGANKKLGIYKEIIEHYSSLHFIDEVGNQLPGTVVKHVTDVFIKHGLILHDKTQIIRDVTIFQNEYFNPLDDATGVLKITPNTRSIHHYAKTWCDNYGPVRTRVMRLLHRTFGVNAFSWIRKLIS